LAVYNINYTWGLQDGQGQRPAQCPSPTTDDYTLCIRYTVDAQ